MGILSIWRWGPFDDALGHETFLSPNAPTSKILHLPALTEHGLSADFGPDSITTERTLAKDASVQFGFVRPPPKVCFHPRQRCARFPEVGAPNDIPQTIPLVSSPIGCPFKRRELVVSCLTASGATKPQSRHRRMMGCLLLRPMLDLQRRSSQSRKLPFAPLHCATAELRNRCFGAYLPTGGVLFQNPEC